MKWKFNIVKKTVTPVEVEADDLGEALEKVYALIPEIDTDHGKVEYIVDTTPSKSLIKWYDDKKVNN